MSHFKYAEPKLRNKPVSQWESWFEYGDYEVESFELVPIEKIIYEEWRPSKTEALLEKMRSGVEIDPINVSAREDGRFSVGDGIHRTTASKILGFTHVPAIVHRTVHSKPDFPIPLEIEVERMNKESSKLLQSLRNEAHAGINWNWQESDENGYRLDVEVEVGDKELKFVLFVSKSGENRVLVLQGKGKVIWRGKGSVGSLPKMALKIHKEVEKIKGESEMNKQAVAEELVKVARLLEAEDADPMAEEKLSSLFTKFHTWATKAATKLSPGAPVATQIIKGMSKVDKKLKGKEKLTGEPAVRALLKAMSEDFTMEAGPIPMLAKKYGQAKIRDMFEGNN